MRSGRLAAWMTRSMGMPGSARAMLSRTERLNRKFSCSTTPTCRRSQVGIDLGDIDAIDQHAPAFRDRQALDELGDGAFPRSRTAHDANDRAGEDVKRQIAQHRRAIDAVAKVHPSKVTRPGNVRQGGATATGARGCRRFHRGVEDIAQTLDRIPACWKSCHNCTRRSTGPLTRPASMLKAMSCPMVNSPRITRVAPSHSRATVVTFMQAGSDLPSDIAQRRRPETGPHVPGELFVPAALQWPAPPPWP